MAHQGDVFLVGHLPGHALEFLLCQADELGEITVPEGRGRTGITLADLADPMRNRATRRHVRSSHHGINSYSSITNTTGFGKRKTVAAGVRQQHHRHDPSAARVKQAYECQ